MENDKVAKVEKNISLTAKTVAAVFSAIAGSAALFYVIGFIIVNLYLASHGIRNLEFGKPEYLTSGISYLFANAIPLIFMLLPWRRTTLADLDKNKSTFNIILVFGVSSLINLFAQYLIINIITRPEYVINYLALSGIDSLSSTIENVKRFHNYAYHVALIYSIGIIILIAYVNNELSKDSTFMFSFIITVSFLMSFLTWSLTVYPHVQSAFGGGQPVEIQLLAKDKKAEELLKASGISFENKLKTSKLQLIDENEKSITVIEPDGAIRLDKTLISNIIYKTKSENKGEKFHE